MASQDIQELLIRWIIMEKTVSLNQLQVFLVTKKGEKQHAVINLKALTNASCQGGPLQDGRVTLHSRHTRDWMVKLKVNDTGIQQVESFSDTKPDKSITSDNVSVVTFLQEVTIFEVNNMYQLKP